MALCCASLVSVFVFSQWLAGSRGPCSWKLERPDTFDTSTAMRRAAPSFDTHTSPRLTAVAQHLPASVVRGLLPVSCSLGFDGLLRERERASGRQLHSCGMKIESWQSCPGNFLRFLQ